MIGKILGTLIVISIPLCLFGLVWIVMIYRSRRHKQLHMTILTLADKGVDIPPALFMPVGTPTSRLYLSLTLCGLGIGLLACLLILAARQWPIGLIPLAVGLAQLLAWWIDVRKCSNDPEKAGR
jgi:hypothetical protein